MNLAPLLTIMAIKFVAGWRIEFFKGGMNLAVAGCGSAVLHQDPGLDTEIGRFTAEPAEEFIQKTQYCPGSCYIWSPPAAGTALYTPLTLTPVLRSLSPIKSQFEDFILNHLWRKQVQMPSKGWLNLESAGGAIPETQFFEGDSAFKFLGLTRTQRLYGFVGW